jgi:hypothetical protein
VAAWLPAIIDILALNGILLAVLNREHHREGGLDHVAQLVDGPEDEPPNLVRRYLRLRDVLNRSLLVLASIVGAGILALGALRNAILAWANAKGDDNILPLELLLAFGLEAAAERNQTLVELLRLDVTPIAAFQAGAVILAPLVSSVLSVTFHSS